MKGITFDLSTRKQCWTERKDFHGPDGIPHNLNSLDECQAACINDSRCVAIDWEPGNAGKTCWILASTAIKETTQPGAVTNYQVNRTCLSESCFYCPPSAFKLYHVAYLSETVVICHFFQIALNDFYDSRGPVAIGLHWFSNPRVTGFMLNRCVASGG